MIASTDSVLISGNTYPVREQIAAMGGKWNKVLKGWMVPADRADEARDLVANAPEVSRSRPQANRGRSVAWRFSTGATVYQNERGRCEDAPCCGCCS